MDENCGISLISLFHDGLNPPFLGTILYKQRERSKRLEIFFFKYLTVKRFIMIILTTIVIESFIFTAYYPCSKKACHPKMAA